jgi:hypothetical protein
MARLRHSGPVYGYVFFYIVLLLSSKAAHMWAPSLALEKSAREFREVGAACILQTEEHVGVYLDVTGDPER